MASMIGNRLSRIRKVKKMTAQQVADFLGLARSTYTGYESGYREPDGDTLSKLAELYEVSTDYLLGRTDDPEPAGRIIGHGMHDDRDMELTDEERERLTRLLHDPKMGVAFRKGILAKDGSNQRRLLKALDILAEMEEDEK